MKLFALLLLSIACAQQMRVPEEAPLWVQSVRDGEEAVKSYQGSKIYYRRIASAADQTRDSACELAIQHASEDIKNEYPLMPVIPYAVEVIYYDQTHKDCAATVSIDSDLPSQYEQMQTIYSTKQVRQAELLAKAQVSADEAEELLKLRSQTAMQYALTGLTRQEYEQFTQDKVYLNAGSGLCSNMFSSDHYSIHGTTQICWRGENILGYCTSKDGKCWTRTP